MRGVVEWMVRNGVAANLLMMLLLVSGLISFFTIPVEVFPENDLDVVQIRVEYPGATPEEIQNSIIQRIEEQVEGIDGIKEVTATAGSGFGVVRIEMLRGEDTTAKLDEIKAEVDRISTFPGEAEEPEVVELSSRSEVVQIGLVGNVSERTLRELAFQVKDDLSLRSEISFVDVNSVRDYELSIEVSNNNLRAYGLSLPEIANAVAQESLELPGGEIETPTEEITLITEGRNYTRKDFGEIVLLSSDNGAQVKLSQVAYVKDAFEESDLVTLYNDKPAAFVGVYRIGDERVQDIINSVYDYLETDLKPRLPEGVDVILWDNDAEELEARLNLMLRNGSFGLILVVLILTLFLDIRVAGWTALGILVAFVGAFTVLTLVGMSINQMSLFGFILAIGIVVDDAIVVGENIFRQREMGFPAREAAIRGAQRMITPVFFAVVTTMVAFFPLLYIPGGLGKFLSAIPAVVIIVLALSLVESMLVLPRHLSHLSLVGEKKQPVFVRFIMNVQGRVSRSLQAFVDGPLHRALLFVTNFPLVIIAAGFAGLLIAAGVVGGNYVKMGFFPEVEGAYVTARVELEPGTPFEETAKVIEHIKNVGYAVGEEFQKTLPDHAPPVIRSHYMIIGDTPAAGGPGGDAVAQPQASKAGLIFQLLEPEKRDFKSNQFENSWREAVGQIPGAKRLLFSADFVGFGEPVSVEVSARDETATMAAVYAIENELRTITGVFDVRNDKDSGKKEIAFRLKPQARTYGLTLQDLALQVRGAFFGIEALRVQRGRDEVRVYVRLPQEERQALSDILKYRVKTPSGNFIPLAEVAEISEEVSPTAIQRRNGRRIVTVTANLEPSIISSVTVNNMLVEGVLADLKQADRDLSIDFGGEERARAETGAALSVYFMLAMLVIYCLLAVAFRSYLKPIIVLVVIPFGFVGAIVGHMIMGLNIVMPSIMGMVGLSGVIINGALVMIDFVNELIAKGATPRGAIVEGVKGRFRPVFLTTMTTFFGVGPLMLEQSTQAQFLVPVAVSLGFGVLVGSCVLIFIVPAVATVLHRAFGVFNYDPEEEMIGTLEGELEVHSPAYLTKSPQPSD